MNTPYYPTYNAPNTPVIPLPNPGEGGPVGPSGNGNNIPVIPLPNPGEGGPVGPGGNGNNIPIIPLPNPGEGGPVGPGSNGNNIPVIPLPNPGEGGPVSPNPGFIITTFPRPNIPCYYCTTGRTASVRFLNTANGYEPFLIYVNNKLVVNGLGFSEISQYGKVASGRQTITISAPNGYIYVQKPISFSGDAMYTIAIIATQTGLDLEQITDLSCSTPNNTACIRTCNLSYNNSPLNVVLNNGLIAFSNVEYKEVTPFKRFMPGMYYFNITSSSLVQPRNGSEVLVSFSISVRRNSIYTIYIFNWGSSPDSIRTMVIEDRK